MSDDDYRRKNALRIARELPQKSSELRSVLETAVIRAGREASVEAMGIITMVMRAEDADYDTRLRAAAVLLDRSFGRPESAERMRNAEMQAEEQAPMDLDHMSDDEVAQLRHLVDKARNRF